MLELSINMISSFFMVFIISIVLVNFFCMSKSFKKKTKTFYSKKNKRRVLHFQDVVLLLIFFNIIIVCFYFLSIDWQFWIIIELIIYLFSDILIEKYYYKNDKKI